LFSPISPLANIIAVPLGTLALMSNLGALICGTWLSVGDGIVQPRRVVFHGGDDGRERMVHQNSRLIFLCARAVVDFNRNLLRRSRRRLSGWLKTTPENLERGGFDFDRRNLFLALGKFAR
jgi:hypothetical protein